MLTILIADLFLKVKRRIIHVPVHTQYVLYVFPRHMGSSYALPIIEFKTKGQTEPTGRVNCTEHLISLMDAAFNRQGIKGIHTTTRHSTPSPVYQKWLKQFIPIIIVRELFLLATTFYKSLKRGRLEQKQSFPMLVTASCGIVLSTTYN